MAIALDSIFARVILFASINNFPTSTTFIIQPVRHSVTSHSSVLPSCVSTEKSIYSFVAPHKTIPLTRGRRKSQDLLLLYSSDSDADTDGVPSSPLDRPVLSLIDTAAILIFAAVGKASHSANGSLDVLAVGITAFPFLVSWFLVSPLMGCFTPKATSDLQQSVIATSKGWIIAIPLACVLRGVIKRYIPPISFVNVTMIATFVILSAGRAAYTALSEVYVEILELNQQTEILIG